MTANGPIAATADDLTGVDTCSISDALDIHELAGAVGGVVPLSVPRRIVGRAVTVLIGRAAGERSARHLGAAAVDASGPGDVIVVAHDGRLDVAGWGGLLSLGACVAGVEGVVIDGACRDLDEAVELGFPVYGRAGVPVTARRRVGELSWGESIQFAGLTVRPGDLVVADRSGVAFVPGGSTRAVLNTARQVARREAQIADALRRHESLSVAMAAGYERLVDRQAD